MKAGGAKVADEHNLSLGVTGCGRDGGGTKALGSVLEAQSAGEHAVAA